MTQVAEGSSEGLEMAVSAAAQGAPAGRRKGLADLVEQNLPEIEKALPPGIMDAERFARIIFTEFRKNPKLLVCTPESFLGALFQTAQLGLEPGGQLGHAYLIPYENRKAECTECQLQIGYKGYVELGGRRGIMLRSREVHKNDDFAFDLGSSEYLHHTWKMGEERGDVIGFYGKIVMPDGKVSFHVMEIPEINARRDRSSAVQYAKSHDWAKTPWDTDYDAMARKTVIRAMIPQVALAPELQVALRADEAVVEQTKTGDLSYLYRDAIDTQALQAPGRPIVVNEPTGAQTEPELAPEPPIPAASGALGAELDSLAPKFRKDAWEALVANFGKELFGDGTEEELEWLKVYLDGPAETQTTEPTEAPPADPRLQEGEASVPAAASDGGAPPWEPSESRTGNQGPAPAVSNELLADTKTKLTAWDAPTCKRVLGEWGQAKTGNLEAMRAKLLMLLAPERAAGNPQATGLF